MHWKDNFGAVLTKTKCHAKCVCDENKELVREIVSVQQTAFYEAYWFTNKFSNVMGLLDFFYHHCSMLLVLSGYSYDTMKRDKGKRWRMMKSITCVCYD